MDQDAGAGGTDKAGPRPKMVKTLSHVFFLDPSPVRRVPIQTGIQRKLNFVSVRTIKG
jgi:hypothetical protein